MFFVANVDICLYLCVIHISRIKTEPTCYTYSILMRNDKILAYKMRVQGRSYAEISEALGMSKSTLSGWFKHLVISKEASEKIRNKGRAASINALLRVNKQKIHKAEQRIKSTRLESRQEIRNLSAYNLLLLGTSLYWSQGYKSLIIKDGKPRSYHPVSFTSPEPAMVKIFLRFLREICEVSEEKIRADVRMFDLKNQANIISYWSKLTDLPLSNFRKAYRSSLMTPYGTIQIRVNDTALFHKIMGWIEGLQNS